MTTHNPEDSAGAQLAMMAAVKLLLSPYKGNAQAMQALDSELEQLHAQLLGTASSERKIKAFEAAADALRQVLKA